jgi:hypothetical protein
MELDDVAGWIRDKGLPIRGNRTRIADRVASTPKLGDRGVEICDSDSEVLTDAGRRLGLDEVKLLAAGVKPGASETEVRPVFPPLETDGVLVEGQSLVEVAYVDGDVVNGERLHAGILASSAPACRPDRPRRGACGWSRPGFDTLPGYRSASS